jgi:D-alanine-D-alanine ligase
MIMGRILGHRGMEFHGRLFVTKIRVALLTGGISSERDVSLSSGDEIINHLDEARYDVTRFDPAFDLAAIVAQASRFDVFFPALHGPYGEDGTIQGLLELL